MVQIAAGVGRRRTRFAVACATLGALAYPGAGPFVGGRGGVIELGSSSRIRTFLAW